MQLTSPGGSLVIIDCGTGAHDLGQSLIADAKGPLRGSILISHTHWDHIQGFPFFAPLFVPGGNWNIYGPAGLGESLRDTLAGQMQFAYFPVTLGALGANIRYHDLSDGSFEIDDIRITTRYLNHPALTLGYRLSMGDRCVVYACDHEPHSRDPGNREPLHVLDQRHSEFLAGADLVIHDAQYTDAEYASKKGWGHSPVEYVSEVAQRAGVRRLALSHHDPVRTDDELDEIVEAVRADLKERGSPMQVFAAADEQIVELGVANAAEQNEPEGSRSAILATVSAVKDSTVILGISDSSLIPLLSEAAGSDGVRVTLAPDGESIMRKAKAAPPALILVEDHPPGLDALGICKNLRQDKDPVVGDVPVVIVSDREKTAEGMGAGVTGWLIKPFSTQFARAQIQARILHSTCRWVRADRPPDEDERLAALRGLSILDTPSEERFDRLTRVAAALAAVPIALVSLVDRDRQWFKSCHGVGEKSTSREVSFCAHVVASRQPMIVSDTHCDDRFADNPIVTGGPRVRFYAGFPLFHKERRCMGSLCLIDTRPRQLSDETIQLLGDLASMVQEELNAGPRRAEV